jgi:MtN3 and saliva related transmembrane protein
MELIILTMDNNLIQIIGSMSGFLTTAAFLPQAYKVYKTKDTNSISLYMFIILNIGLMGWVIYGLVTNQLPIILTNIITFILAFYILLIKIKGQKL